MAEQNIDIVNLLKDKSALIQYLINMIKSSEKFAQNLPEMKEKGWSQEGMLDKVIEISAIQSAQIKHLALIAFLFVKSSQFDTAVGHMMIDMGRGEEALRAMMESKLRRK